MQLKKSTTPFLILMVALLAAILQGCTATYTFPKVARAGDTLSIMVAGSEDARKEFASVILEDANGDVYDLQSMGLVRSVFNLRMSGVAKGAHYTSHSNLALAWSKQHEPLQTVLVTDLPQNLALGIAALTINLNVSDDASNTPAEKLIAIEIVDGVGSSDMFSRQPNEDSADFTLLETAPYAKITFDNPFVDIGAAEIVVDYDESIVNPENITVYSPTAKLRDAGVGLTGFGSKQRMIYWYLDASTNYIHINVVAPQGVQSTYLMLYILHKEKSLTDPRFRVIDYSTYDVSGAVASHPLVMKYHP